ncbi:MAG: zinc ribbon domain-containing protein [Deltaproteobacteria bacterium]|nr:zinc ribbon domain-containing protein [Deltaproteobacteria bacterium]
MPLFEYTCTKCSHQFEALVFGQEIPSCPKCRSSELERILSVVSVGRGSEQAAAQVAEGCGGCGDPTRNGGCPFK